MMGRVLLALVLTAALAGAQAPDERWRTLRTPHFRVHYPEALSPLAQRAAGEAERAWTALAAELVPPRGTIELIVTDHVDASNGWATPFPTNRMAVYARPPVDDPALRIGEDWLRLVVTHELAHLFHLDRTRGLWRVAQGVFGRHPALFPHLQAPRWLIEGIAMHYERQAGGGRYDGSQLHAVLGARDAAGVLATPRTLALGEPRFPGGNGVYFGGARIVEAGVAAGGDRALRRFIEHGAGRWLPFHWDASARAAFGASLVALAASAGDRAPAPLPAGAQRSGPAWWEARAPRWRGDTLRFTATAPRQIPAVFDVVDGRVQRGARRNGVDAHGQAGPHAVYADVDLTDPYRLRSHLVREERAWAGDDSLRLASPDVREDGAVVAVVTTAGGTGLLQLAPDGARRVLMPASVDTQWSAPRWSRGGDRVAALRWTRGGVTSVVVLDTLGAVLHTLAAAPGVQQHPSWMPGDDGLVFASDREGAMALYHVALADGAVTRVAAGAAGLFDPEVSHDGTQVAAFALDAEGYTLVTLPWAAQGPVMSPPTLTPAPAAAPRVDAAGARYRPWPSLLPRYWIPTTGTSVRGDRQLGFFTSARDVVGRHELGATGVWDLRTGELTGGAAWRYSGLGLPLLDVTLSQAHDVFAVADTSGRVVGELARRNRIAGLALTWTRPRVRSGASATLGTEVEWRDFRTEPAPLLAQLDPVLGGTLQYPGVVASVGWNNLMRAPLALSVEDGVALSLTSRHRWRRDDPSATRATSHLGDVRLFRSLPLPGHARHVLALRAVGGTGDRTMGRPFSVGGVSGSSIEVLPGFQLGDPQRAFGVRGTAPGTLQGVRAWGGSAEWRAPLPLVGRGLWPLPGYWQRSGLTLFGDAGSAWCPPGAPSAGCPAGGTARETLWSAGAELLLDVAVDYDTPTRFRVGAAYRPTGVAWYLTAGVPF
jgi:hypothetical protein